VSVSPQARRALTQDFRFRRIAAADSVLYLFCSWWELAGLERAVDIQEEGVMTKSHPKREEPTPLRPVGVALAAVVAGLGAAKAQAAEPRGQAPLEPATHEKTYVVDPTNHPGFEEDPDMVLGKSEAVEPLRQC
jgi:hypothetical protein